MSKLCYVLPEYDEQVPAHFYHVYELIENAAAEIDIFLYIEHLKGLPKTRNVKGFYAQKLKNPILGLLEKMFIFLYLRLIGYKRFWVHYSYSGAIGASIITRFFGGKAYFWHCELRKEFESRWGFSLKSIKTKIFTDYAFRLLIKLVNLVTGTESMKNRYSKDFGIKRDKIKVMPNWINPERFDPKKYNKIEIRRELGIPPNKKVVLFVHWLSKRKGAHHLPGIIKNVTKEARNVLFVVVGDGPYRKKMKEDIKKSDLNAFVRLEGEIPNKEIPKYYSAADVFILPSEEEGFPRVLLECMAMELPFVTTDVGGVGDILTEQQKWGMIPRGDMTNFSKKLTYLIQDDELKKSLISEGRKNVSNYAIGSVVQRFLAITSSGG